MRSGARPRARRRLGLGAGWLLAGLGWACAGPVWDATTWAEARPELAGRDVGRLGDATPYLIASADRLHLFLCRWPDGGAIPVSLPPDASETERALLDRALVAWERAVPGLRFAATDGEAALRLRFSTRGREGASAAVVCRVTPPFDRAGPLDARLVDAELVLRREEADAWGRPRRLADEELLGAAVHELGHALGLQGHVGRGGSALRREPEAVRRVGRRVLGGASLVEPAAAALYALPSGVRVETRRLPRGASAPVDAIAQRALEAGAQSVWLQLGDRAQETRWGPDPSLVYYLKDPAELVMGSSSLRQALSLPSHAGAARQPMSGSRERALAMRFAAGAVSPRVFKTRASW